MNKILIAMAISAISSGCTVRYVDSERLPTYPYGQTESVQTVTIQPAPIQEVIVTAPQPGGIWESGYWYWQPTGWVWVQGSWYYPTLGWWVPGLGWRTNWGYRKHHEEHGRREERREERRDDRRDRH